jgi:predicted AAA+ superfamily ATPase
MISRKIAAFINKRLSDRKVLILLGPRQVGKTTLLKDLTADQPHLWLNGDDPDIRQQLSNQSTAALRKLIGDNKLIIIDEAQRIINIGLTLKQIHDNIDGVKVIATGSSALDLANEVNEPLTGRKWEYLLYPISAAEMVQHTSELEEKRVLHHRLIYGMYPDVINNPGDEKALLSQLADSYLYKDLLTWGDIKKPQKLETLTQALAFQMGNEVSNNELGQLTGLNSETVERYIYLLEKAFVIFRLPSLSRNLRNELKKRKKIYFYDNGIRNAIIKNWKPVGLRNDIGQLWENYLIVERIKQKSYTEVTSNDFFWRTHAQQEIDFIEDRDGVLHAYEFKWNPKRKAKWSKTFTRAYPEHRLMAVHQDNYLDFIYDR